MSSDEVDRGTLYARSGITDPTIQIIPTRRTAVLRDQTNSSIVQN